ncbi:MAG TPA: DUF2877 domain-containing protein [Pseudolysinimonas sp.]|nr:DUF2877 domain-containing protein [Pseudolysinimonas sp.]
MTPPPVIDSPAWVRVDAADPAPWRMAGNPSVVHLGHSALVLGAGRRQLVITSDAFGLVPGGMQVRPPEFARLRRDLARRDPARGAAIHGWRPAVVEPADLRVTAIDIDSAALDLLERATTAPGAIGAFDPSRQRAEASALARAARDGADVADTLLRLIGAGPGSTPAGDDVVAGVLAGLRAAGLSEAAAELGARVLPLLGRTTAASTHYLEAAATGRFADRVHALVAGLRSARSAPAAIRAAATFGASSGTDLLAGIVAGARITPAIRKSA